MKVVLLVVCIFLSFIIKAQEFGVYRIEPIEHTPGLSEVREIIVPQQFNLIPIDLSVDIRLQALRSSQGFSMIQNSKKSTSKFRMPSLFPETSESDAKVRFSVGRQNSRSETTIPGTTIYGTRFNPYTGRPLQYYNN